MLRTVTSRTTSRLIRHHRTLVTSQQKRAIKKEHLTGSGTDATTNNNAPIIKSATTTAIPAAAAAPPSSSGGGAGMMIFPVVGIAAVGAAAGAYYMDMIPAEWLGNDANNNKKNTSNQQKEEIATTKIIAAAPPSSAKKEVSKPKTIVMEKKKTVAVVEKNRVTQIPSPPIDKTNNNNTNHNRPPPTPASPPTHSPNAHRVSVELMNQHNTSNNNTSNIQQPPSSSKEEEASKEVVVVVVADNNNDNNNTNNAVDEKKKESAVMGTVAKEALFNEVLAKEDEEQKKFHRSLRANLDEAFLSDLDSLSPTQLRIRVVQLASELGERTKWEAVRLQEFLTRKEKEVADKYMEILQKQRLEFEDLLARRLREQEDAITRSANALLQSKEDSIQSVVNATADALKQEHEAEIKSAEERFNREYNAKYEVESKSQLAAAKKEFANNLQTKVNTIEELSQRLSKLEQLLQISRNFEIGSQAAHRVSAAALAMAEKLESNLGAGEEIAALNAAAAENAVIASALSQIPSSVRKGISTITQLQSKFEKVYTVGRQAALVPEGRSGVEAQLAGMLFATLTVPPTPESETSTNDSSSAEYILARANEFVTLGNLEQAIAELDTLQGQTAFVTKDWKQAAMDRLSVDKAVKVIKMECALLNNNMGGS